MKYRIWIYVFLISTGFALFSGCSNKPTPLPDMNSPAARLYISRCGMCHSVPHPKRLYYTQWEHMVEVMDKQMEQRGMPPLTDREKHIILQYLKHHARR